MGAYTCRYENDGYDGSEAYTEETKTLNDLLSDPDFKPDVYFKDFYNSLRILRPKDDYTTYELLKETRAGEPLSREVIRDLANDFLANLPKGKDGKPIKLVETLLEEGSCDLTVNWKWAREEITIKGSALPISCDLSWEDFETARKHGPAIAPNLAPELVPEPAPEFLGAESSLFIEADGTFKINVESTHNLGTRDFLFYKQFAHYLLHYKVALQESLIPEGTKIKNIDRDVNVPESLIIEATRFALHLTFDKDDFVKRYHDNYGDPHLMMLNYRVSFGILDAYGRNIGSVFENTETQQRYNEIVEREKGKSFSFPELRNGLG